MDARIPQTIRERWSEPNGVVPFARQIATRNEVKRMFPTAFVRAHPYRPEGATFTTTNFENRTRRCWRCGEWKPFEDFNRNYGDSAGRMHECRLCKNASERRRKAALREARRSA